MSLANSGSFKFVMSPISYLHLNNFKILLNKDLEL